MLRASLGSRALKLGSEICVVAIREGAPYDRVRLHVMGR